MSMYLEINGVPYTGFTNCSASKSMEAAAGSFNFTAAGETPRNCPIKNGSATRILINGEPIITGFVEKIHSHSGRDGYSLQISGRDRTCDFIDSSIPPKMEFNAAGTLKNIAEQALESIGAKSIKVIDLVGNLAPFKVGEIVSGSMGETCFEFVERNSRKRQVLITCDGNGNLVITRASSQLIKTMLIRQADGKNNNILDGNMDLDSSKRFNTVGMWAQQIDPSYTDVKAPPAIDKGIRDTRRLIVSAESPMNLMTAAQRVIWETNIRRARGTTYTCTVASYKAQADGALWKPNMLVRVIDEDCMVDAQLLIKSATYTLNESNGEETQLEMCPADAFTLDAVMKAAEASINNIASDLTEQE